MVTRRMSYFLSFDLMSNADGVVLSARDREARQGVKDLSSYYTHCDAFSCS